MAESDVHMSPEDQEFQNLPVLLSQWKKIQEEKRKLSEEKKLKNRKTANNKYKNPKSKL